MAQQPKEPPFAGFVIGMALQTFFTTMNAVELTVTSSSLDLASAWFKGKKEGLPYTGPIVKFGPVLLILVVLKLCLTDLPAIFKSRAQTSNYLGLLPPLFIGIIISQVVVIEPLAELLGAGTASVGDMEAVAGCLQIVVLMNVCLFCNNVLTYRAEKSQFAASLADPAKKTK